HAEHGCIEGHLGWAWAEHVPRSGEDPEGRNRRAQLHAVRFAADWRQVRRTHVPVHRGKELQRAHGARGFDVKDRRRPTLLSASAWADCGGRGFDDREWFL